MIKNYIFLPIIALVLSLSLFIGMFSSVAKAVTGDCYFKNTGCSISGYGAYGTNDVFPGRDSNGNGRALSDSSGNSINSKAEFVNFIDSKWNAAAGTKSWTGARFVVSKMITSEDTPSYPTNAQFATWKTDILNDSDVTFWSGSVTVGKTSYWDNTRDDDFFGAHPNVSRNVIRLYYAGGTKIWLEIETGCGNVTPKTKPKPPSAWDLEGTSTVSPGFGYPRDVLTFTHTIKNEGPGPKPNGLVSAFVREWIFRPNAAGDYDDIYMNSYDTGGERCNKTLAMASGASFSCSKTMTVRDDAQKDDIYCQLIYFAPDSSSRTKTDSSDMDCAEVRLWSLQASSTVNGQANVSVLPGQSVTFSHTLKNIGPNSLNKSVDGNIFWNVTSNVPGADFPTCNTWVAPYATTASNCYSYRATGLDLASGTSVNGSKTQTKTYAFSQPGKYCEYISYNPSNANDFNATVATSTQACVFVVSATPSTPTAQEFEKGSAGFQAPTSFTATVNDGGNCPPAGSEITFTLRYTIKNPGGTVLQNGDQTITYGGASCSVGSYPITLNDAAKNAMNDSTPGTAFPLTTSIVETGVTQPAANIIVIEVPFARFYGNDIVARSGNIRFNSSSSFDSSVGGRGSVSQFGAFATTAQQIIQTAAFRYGEPAGAAPNYTPQTQPTDGLKAKLATSPDTVSAIIDKLQLPDGCVGVSGVDTLSAHGWANALTGADKCFNVSKPAPFNVTPTTGGSDQTYSSKVTVKSANDVYITQNIINSTPNASYADEGTTGVFLIVSNGDVFINKNVNRVDAIILAKGNIYTCAENGTTNVTTPNRTSSCRSNLTINGSIAATKIYFDRSAGTRLFSDENNQSGAAGTSNISARTITNANTDGRNKASEVVNFPAYLYFTHPYLKSSTMTSYDALFNAPPRL